MVVFGAFVIAPQFSVARNSVPRVASLLFIHIEMTKSFFDGSSIGEFWASHMAFIFYP